MLTRRYLEPLQTTVAGADIVATLRAYLECRMHVERTAEKLAVHPNTVRYRISRFEELAGASLRDVSVAGEVWWALQAPPPA
jgi:DNA-binding PucR family transcriptional regulator